MGVVLNILTFLVGAALALYGVFVIIQSVRGDGDAFAGINMILIPLFCIIMALILPPFREFASENLKIIFVLVGVLVVCTGILSCFDTMNYFPGIINGIGVSLLGVWASGVIPEDVIYPIVYGLANIVSAFFIPVLAIVLVLVALKSMFW